MKDQIVAISDKEKAFRQFLETKLCRIEVLHGVPFIEDYDPFWNEPNDQYPFTESAGGTESTFNQMLRQRDGELTVNITVMIIMGIRMEMT